MSAYIPASGAVPNNVTFIAQLSQRDVSLQVPINYITYVGTTLSAACFGNNKYLDTETAECFSNLLASGFRSFGIDLFWDASRQVWSLCPVQLDGSGNGASSASATSMPATAVSANIIQPTQTLMSSLLNDRSAPSAQPTMSMGTIPRYQSDEKQLLETAERILTQTTSASAATTSKINVLPRQATVDAGPSTPENGTVIDLGPYSCSTSLSFDSLLQTLVDHYVATNNDLAASFVRLVLNLHAAAPASYPTGSAQRPAGSQMPSNSSLLNQILNERAGSYLYTPSQLASQRSDLSGPTGWLEVAQSVQPYTSYFEVDTQAGKKSTQNGWPGKGFLEFVKYQRLIVEFGSIDPQMESYDMSKDAATIFASGYITSQQNVSISSDGFVTNGCFFDPDQTLLGRVNSSWAVSSSMNASAQSLAATYNEVSSLIKCGVSPILNTTLNGKTANEDYEPYFSFAQHGMWSWAPGQPVNASASKENSNDRCTTLNATTGLWAASDCGAYYVGACRMNKEPYNWQVSSPATMYYKVDEACPTNGSFDVPRTALENAYVLSAFRQYQKENSNSASSLLWLDFNDLDVATCWVSGQNTTCPYSNDPSSTSTQELVVPTVAGIIILVLAALTVLVKCAGNRRNSKKRRRRGDNGWDYEGVPA